MTNYPLSAIQAQAILDMRLQRLTGLERDKIVRDYEEILKEIERLKGILGSEALVTQIIKEELLEIRNKYADERKTEIVPETADLTIEDLITEEEMVITVTHYGYIKRLALSTYRSQRRGGKGLTGMETREEDYVEQLFIGSTHDYMLFFSNFGRLYWLKTYQIPESSRTAKGKAMVNLFPLAEGERISTAISVKDFKDGYLVMFTKAGIVKKTKLDEYSNPRSKGIIAVNLDEGDELIVVSRTSGKSDLVIGTKNGLAIRFKEEDARSVGRTARGVIGIRLTEGDEVVSANVIEERTTLLTVTEKGLGKRTNIDGYPVHRRGGKGVISIKVVEKGGNAVGLIQVQDEDEIVLITNGGMVIRMPARNISVLGRNTQGVKLMDLDPEDRIVSMGRVVEE
jgi:DNA gyrase subunit A